jgi:hypothetical protein
LQSWESGICWYCFKIICIFHLQLSIVWMDASVHEFIQWSWFSNIIKKLWITSGVNLSFYIGLSVRYKDLFSTWLQLATNILAVQRQWTLNLQRSVLVFIMLSSGSEA